MKNVSLDFMKKLLTTLFLSLILSSTAALAGDAARKKPTYGAAESAWEIIADIKMFEVLMNRATVEVQFPQEGPNYRSIVAIYSYREPTNIDAQDLHTQYISDVRKVVFNCDTGKRLVLFRTLWSEARANGTQLASYSYKPSSYWSSATFEPGSAIGKLFSVACNQPSYWTANEPARSKAQVITQPNNSPSSATEIRPWNNAGYCSSGAPECGPKSTWAPNQY